ncbi:MAG: two-component system, NarL family, sensor kinase [Sphingomonadales bacterium]|jgi:PAS domain S-box-containing protein|nr:two-component system, NarL family, sensor kinase [Sphingomonadales bacterium]
MDRDATSSRAVDPGAFYRGMLQHLDVAFFVIQISPGGQFLVEDGNPAVEKWLGRPIEEMKGRPVRDCLAPPGVEFLETNLHVAIEKRESHSYYRAVDLAEGALSWFTTLIPVFEGDGPVTHVLGMVRDIVHEKQTGVETIHRRELIDQSHRLGETLHEATGQHLAAARLALTRLEIFAAPHVSGRGKDLDDAIGDARSSIEEIKREIGVLTYVLHPPVLDSHDLGEALRVLAEGFGQRSGIAIDLRIVPEAYELPFLASMPLFRVLQEALANVHRHAHAGKVTVALEIADAEVVLTVADDGIGFDGRWASARAPGSGLAGMRDRMVQLGGTLVISSHGVGTTIVARSPLIACMA